MYGPPEMAQAPTAITIFGGGTASHVFFKASRMFSVTGPVISRPSACRGEATYWIPKRPRSKTGVPSTLTSALQALQSPALTTRSLSDLPKRRRSFCSSAAARGYSSGPRSTRASRVLAARRYSVVKAMAPSGQAWTQSGQNRQRPRSRRNPSLADIAPVGHASTQALQPSEQREGSSTGSPRKRSGIAGGESGNAEVRCPCCARARNTFNMRTSQVVTAVREIEALVAEWKVGDLLVAQRHLQTSPVVKGRIDDLVAREASLVVCDGGVADLAAPSFDERDTEETWPRRAAGRADRSFRKLTQLLAHEDHRALDLQPADVGARIDVARCRGGNGNVRESVHAPGVRLTHVALQARGARRHPHHAQFARHFRGYAAGLLEPRTHRGRRPKQPDGVLHVAKRRLELVRSQRRPLRFEVETRAAGSPGPAAESAAAEERGQVEKIATKPAAVRRRGEEADVPGGCAQVARVIREALQLERDRAQRLAAGCRARTSQGLQVLTVRARVSHGRVAGQRLGVMDAALVRSADQCRLQTAVLIAERDLQMEDLLAVTLEAEVPRLDHARVHGSDRDLVYFLSLDAIEVGHAALRVHPGRPAPGVAAAPRRMETDRLEPGMAFGLHAPLLGDLALEQVRLGALRRHRRERLADHLRPRSLERARRVVGEDQHELDLFASGSPEKRGNALAALRRFDRLLPERLEREQRHLVAGNGDAVEQLHGFTSTKVAAFCTSATSGAGR